MAKIPVHTIEKYYDNVDNCFYQLRPDGIYERISHGGAAHVTDPSYTFVKYSSGGYTYLCEAIMGTARATAAWRVVRITDATGDMVYAGVAGTTVGTFAFSATDAATVAALTYTLGA